jgi:hypothetical protein
MTCTQRVTILTIGTAGRHDADFLAVLKQRRIVALSIAQDHGGFAEECPQGETNAASDR